MERASVRLSRQDWELIADQLGASEMDIALLDTLSQSNEPNLRLRASEIRTRLDTPPSQQYLRRRLTALVEAEVLLKSGSGPQTRYALNERRVAEVYLGTDRALRASKSFDIGLIHAYEPGRSRLMPTAIATELRRLSDAVIKAGETINQVVFRRYMVDFAWASSRMEGNTYSLLETQALLDHDTPAAGKSPSEATMLRNHAAAIEYVIANARDLEISPHTIRGIHAMLSKGLLPNPDDEGRIRHSPVSIGASVYRPAAMPQALEEGLRLIAEKTGAIDDPYEASLFLLAELSRLQPFMDVNKRTARVVCNLPLLKATLCPLSYYGLDDDAYITGLIAYYETHSSALLADAYRQGYRAAAERYRSYSEHLSEAINHVNENRANQVAQLVSQYMRAVVAYETGPDARDQFLRKRIDEKDPMVRDTLLLSASKALARLSEPEMIGMGVSISLLKRYRKAIALLDRDSPTPE